MDKELAGGLRHVEVVGKEGPDRGQGLAVDLRRIIVPEDLIQEHAAEVDGQLVDQPSYTQLIVGEDAAAGIEDLSHIHGHTGLLVGPGQVLELRYDGPVGGAGVHHGLGSQHIHGHGRDLFELFIVVLRGEGLDQDHAVFLHLRQVVAPLGREESRHHLRSLGPALYLRGGGGLVRDFKDHDRPVCGIRDMELSGPVVDIDHEQIVQQQILEKVSPVQALFIGRDQGLQLAGDHFGHHEGVIAGARRRQDIKGLPLVEDLEQVAVPYDLAVHGRPGEAGHDRPVLRDHLRRGGYDISIQVLDAELRAGDGPHILQAVFYDL